MTAAFKAGDKVEFIMDYPQSEYKRVDKGDTGTIKVAVGRDELVTVTLDKNGESERVYARRLKLVEEKPLTLKGFTVGDKVRYTPSLWKGLEGTVHAFHGEYVEVMVTKLPDNPNMYSNVVVGKTINQTVGGLGVSPFSLEKIVEEPKPFTYKDIQVGDKIRRTRTYSSGSVEIREGVATDPAYGGYWSDGQFILAYPTDDNVKAKGTVTLELLDRPEPEPKPVKAPEPWDNAKTGDVLFRVDKADGARDTFIKKADGGWTIFYPDGSAEFQIGAEEKLSSYFLGTECIAATVS